MSWGYSNILDRSEAFNYGASLIGAHQKVLPTGLKGWDEACDETGQRGLGEWWYVVIGGASNSGKTQLMLHLARQAADNDLVPGVITMEVPKSGLQRRLYSNLSSFTFFDFLPHHWEMGEPVQKAERLRDEITEYARGARIVIAEQQKPPTLTDITEACEELRHQGCDCIFVDHLQLIKAVRADEISDRATEISEALRWFAHSNRVLVVALSQLNRLASRERGRRPTMHDLLGGTSIESNSNQVVLLDHSNQERDPHHTHLLRTWIYLDKNREGPNRILIPVEINFRTGVWREAMPDESQRWPGAKT